MPVPSRLPAQRVVLITGCSVGGIGAALAKEAAKSGCRVFATARNKDKMQGLEEHGCELLELDVLEQNSIDACVQEVLTRTGGVIDILINNAGVLASGPFVDGEFSNFEMIIQTNFLGMVRMAKSVLPRMIKREQGLVVNVGSILAGISQPFALAYAASKAAVRSWSNGLRQELAMLGVRVMLLEPGMIATGMTPSNLRDGDDSRDWVPAADSPYAGIEPVERLINTGMKGAFVEKGKNRWHFFSLIRFICTVRRRFWFMPGFIYRRLQTRFPENRGVALNVDVFAKTTMMKILARKPPRYHSIGGLSTIWWTMGSLYRPIQYWAETVFADLRGDYRPSTRERRRSTVDDPDEQLSTGQTDGQAQLVVGD